MKWCQERWVMRNLRGKTKAWLSFSAPSFEDLVTPEGIDDGRPVFRENCTLTHRSLGAVTSLSGLFCAPAATLGEVEVVRIVSCDQRPLPRSFVAAVESKRPFHEEMK